MEKKKINFGLVAILCGIGSFFPFFTFSSLNIIVMEVACLIGLILAVLAIVFAIMGMKTSKGLGIASIILGIFGIITMGIMCLGTMAVKSLENCTEKEGGNIVCEVPNSDGQTLEIPKEIKDLITEKQYKK